MISWEEAEARYNEWMNYIQEHLEYTEDTVNYPSGLRWKKKPSRAVKVGDPVGALHHGLYHVTKIKGKQYSTHHIVACLEGIRGAKALRITLFRDPGYKKHQVDHIEGLAKGNVASNLRVVTALTNNHNRTLNREGHLAGTTKRRLSKLNPWRANIKLEGKYYYLGSYPYATFAHFAYTLALALHNSGYTIDEVKQRVMEFNQRVKH